MGRNSGAGGAAGATGVCQLPPHVCQPPPYVLEIPRRRSVSYRRCPVVAHRTLRLALRLALCVLQGLGLDTDIWRP
eukprot:1441063-Pyramimonas_sp.AAC.1